MKPPILRWKVVLALVAVVVAAVSLGGALRPGSQTPAAIQHRFFGTDSSGAVASLLSLFSNAAGGAQAGGWTGYTIHAQAHLIPLYSRSYSRSVTVKAVPARQMRLAECRSLKQALRHVSRGVPKADLKRIIRKVCSSRR